MNYKNMGASSATPAPLARQSSVYSLTFDEFQNTIGGMGLGKDFGSMNMDEFLKNIWTAEESQAMGGGAGAAAGPSGGLQRQGSLTLPRTLSLKTVGEVWKDLANGGGAQDFQQQQQQQPSLGEMTLEEFLVRAGVVREDMNQPPPQPLLNGTTAVANGGGMMFGDLSASAANSNSGITLAFGQPVRNNGGSTLANTTPASLGMVRPYAATLPVGNATDLASHMGMRTGGMIGIGDQVNNGLMNGMVGLGGGGLTVATGSPVNQTSSDGLPRGNGDLSSLSPAPYVLGSGMRRKSGGVEKVVERRQKRMIKNRESAARSRARKQAYTMELEAEVAKLKEQNEELMKKQAEIMEMQKNQVLELISDQHVAKKRCLRRTQTGPW